MAIFWRGFEPGELATWTAAMIESGERLDLSAVTRPTVDKHSTGGVGDKVSLILVPLVAACGAAVPQLSGRGLGHTGGTLDKMEAIPGWRAQLSPAEMIAILDDVGGVIAAAGAGTRAGRSQALRAARRHRHRRVDPADRVVDHVEEDRGGNRRARARREVRERRVPARPRAGRELAETMVAIGEANGVRTVALQTAMETVLGCAAGNGLEVTESVETLEGGGPADLVEITVALAREMVALAGVDCDDPADVLASGRALPVWRAMVAAQGGDPDAPIPTATEIETVTAPHGGVLTRLDARAVGRVRVAPRRGAGTQGASGVAVGRRGVPGQARPSGQGRRRAARTPRRRPGQSCPMPWPRSKAVSRSASEPIAPAPLVLARIEQA